MASASDRKDSQNRRCLVAGTQVYGEGVDDLDHVPAELALVRSVLAEACDYSLLTEVGLNPTAADFKTAVHEAVVCKRDAEAERSGVLTVYYSGHGFIRAEDFQVLAFEGSYDKPGTHVSASDLASLVLQGGPDEAVVIVDACQSGEAVDAFSTLFSRIAQRRSGDHNLHLITATSRVEDAAQLAFADAFAGALRAPAIPHRTRYIDPAILVRDIRFRMRPSPGGGPHHTPFMTESRPSIAFPNPLWFNDARLRPPEATCGTGWAFCGRRSAIRDLVAYLQEAGPDEPPRLVTGGAGSGKSILLAWLRAASEGQPLDTVDRRSVASVPRGCVDALVDASGCEAKDVIESLAAELALANGASDAEVFAALERMPGPVRILIDSVDRANSLDELLECVLNPLRSIPSTRLVVAASTALPNWQADQIDLDSPDYFEPGAVRQFVRVLLERRQNSLFANAPGWKLDELSEMVAGNSEKSFRRAYLFAVDRAVHAQGDAEGDMHLSAAGAFGSQLASLDPGDQTRAADLLTPLAFVLGAGMPHFPLWAETVRRLSGREVGYSDLRWILDAASEYVSEAQVGRSRTGWRLTPGEPVVRLRQSVENQDVHGAFVDALLSLNTVGGDRVLWPAADAYTKSHFAEHALMAGRLDEYLDDPEFLLAADATGLRRALALAGTERARTVRDLCDQARDGGAGDGCEVSRIALLAAAHDYPVLARRALELTTGWRAKWANRTPADAVTAISSSTDRYLVVSAQDGAVLVQGSRAPDWRRLSAPKADSASAVSAGHISGRPCVLVGSWSGRLTVHALDTYENREIKSFDDRVIACSVTADALLAATHRSWWLARPGRDALEMDSDGLVLSCATLAQVDGSMFVVACSAYEVAVWDLDGILLRTFQTSQDQALTAVTSHGDSILVAANDGTVYQCDVKGRSGRILARHSGQRVTSVKALSQSDTTAVLSTGIDGSVTLTTPGPRGMQQTEFTINVGIPVYGADLERCDNGIEVVAGTSMGTARIRVGVGHHG